MIKMFDRDKTGQINMAEFHELWGYLGQWRQVFDCYDRNKSGSITQQELGSALHQMGYRFIDSNGDISVTILFFLDSPLNLFKHFTRSTITIEMDRFNLMVLYIPLF